MVRGQIRRSQPNPHHPMSPLKSYADLAPHLTLALLNASKHSPQLGYRRFAFDCQHYTIWHAENAIFKGARYVCNELISIF